jgi:hypothetical protein
VVAGARVTAINEGTDFQSQAVSDDTGGYQFPLLRAGRYRLTAEAPGFQKLLRTDVIVNTTERIHLDLMLQVGGVNETITVSAETTQLQSEKATVGSVVGQKTIDAKPHPASWNLGRRYRWAPQRRSTGYGKRQRERERIAPG